MHTMKVSHQNSWNPGFSKFSSLFFPIMPYGRVFSTFKDWPTLIDLNYYKPVHVCSFLSHNIHFVEQRTTRLKKNCFANLYDPRIFLQGEVNTRANNWHDFFNAMIWYSFPRTKAVINMRQFISFDENAEFPWKTPPKNRTREQDYLTMFDEGGCILIKIDGGDNFSIPFLFGHGFYERVLYGDHDLSACTLEINFDLHKFGATSEEILLQIDKDVSSILSNRSFYRISGAFKSIELKKLEYNLNNFLWLTNKFNKIC